MSEHNAEQHEAAEDRARLIDMHEQVRRLADNMNKAQIGDFVQLMNSPLKLIWTNFLSGTARGVGIAVGFTFFASTILYLLQALGALNLPIIGSYIADLVEHVQAQLELRRY